MTNGGSPHEEPKVKKTENGRKRRQTGKEEPRARASATAKPAKTKR